MVNRHSLQVWNDTSGCFGRLYMYWGLGYGGIVLPGLAGRSEDEKRALVLSPECWRTLDMREIGPFSGQCQRLAAARPRNVFVELWCASWQFAADPGFGTRPASLTPEREALLSKCKGAGYIRAILSRAGPDDRSYSLNTDRDLYAELVVNLLAKMREIFPPDTRFLVTMSNETNWPSMFWNKPIIDDVFDSLARYGD